MAIHVESNPIREFDAHIYYTEASRAKAEKVHAALKRDFSGEDVQVSPLIDRAIGPHPLPMFEVNFQRKDYQRVFDWLYDHRKNLDVLIHEVTGDDIRDHTDGACWLGKPVNLDFSQLDPSPA